MKVGLFGGSFNPIHTGHLIVIDQAMEQLELDKLIVMPAACNPLKINDKDMAPAEHRLAMARIATSEIRNIYPTLEVSDMEIKRGPPSYMIDTVEQLIHEHMHYPPHGRILAGGISIIIGADSFESLPRWHDIGALVSLANFVVAQRSVPILNVSVDPKNNFQPYSVYGRIKTTSIDIPTFDTSGTEVRERLKVGRSVKYLIPDVVEKYIRDNGLYLTSK